MLYHPRASCVSHIVTEYGGNLIADYEYPSILCADDGFCRGADSIDS